MKRIVTVASRSASTVASRSTSTVASTSELPTNGQLAETTTFASGSDSDCVGVKCASRKCASILIWSACTLASCTLDPQPVELPIVSPSSEDGSNPQSSPVVTEQPSTTGGGGQSTPLSLGDLNPEVLPGDAPYPMAAGDAGPADAGVTEVDSADASVATEGGTNLDADLEELDAGVTPDAGQR